MHSTSWPIGHLLGCGLTVCGTCHPPSAGSRRLVPAQESGTAAELALLVPSDQAGTGCTQQQRHRAWKRAPGSNRNA